MKNRNIPFGYQYAEGVITVNPTEAETVKAICGAYLGGQSLLTISKQLNEQAVEYMPGVTGWNKARLMRILEDRRYLGTDAYPVILDEAVYEAIQSTKMSRNTQKGTDRSTDIYKLETPVLCPKCGAEMHRRHDSRCKCNQRWFCTNRECGELIVVADENLLPQITELLNIVIADPDRIKIPADTEIKSDIEILKTENEIGRTLDSVEFDKEALRRKMLRCLSLKYKSIDHTTYTIKKMKADLEKASPLSDFSASLVARTVKAITLNTDRSVCLTLINGQIIRKENEDHASSHNPTDAA